VNRHNKIVAIKTAQKTAALQPFSVLYPKNSRKQLRRSRSSQQVLLSAAQNSHLLRKKKGVRKERNPPSFVPLKNRIFNWFFNWFANPRMSRTSESIQPELVQTIPNLFRHTFASRHLQPRMILRFVNYFGILVHFTKLLIRNSESQHLTHFKSESATLQEVFLKFVHDFL